jgi:hypothetical protein
MTQRVTGQPARAADLQLFRHLETVRQGAFLRDVYAKYGVL